MLPTPGFHHLHLNSMNPDTAIAFYAKEFPSTSKTTWAGLTALKSPNNAFLHYLACPWHPFAVSPTAVRKHAAGGDLADLPGGQVDDGEADTLFDLWFALATQPDYVERIEGQMGIAWTGAQAFASGAFF